MRGSRITGIPYGPVDITVVRSNGRKWSSTVTVDENLEEVVVPRPRPARRGTLLVNSRPWSKVYINGRYRGRTGKSYSLAPGEYKITLKRPGGLVRHKKARVVSGKQAQVIVIWPR